jgi:tetratricopeptide (TPR) repeat protein
MALLLSEAADAKAPACASWPGEPSPLPTLASSDPVLARWVVLRAQELKLAARTAEASAPARANRLWQHLLCLEPASDDATQGVERTLLVRVHRPPVVVVRTLLGPESTPALSRLDEAIRVVAVPAPRAPVVTPASTPPQSPQPAPAFDWTRTDAALGTAEAQLGEANFEAALAVAEQLRRQLRDTAATSGARERQARAEVVAATAEIALGREDAARKSFERALAANPKLRLDPAATSPKVRRTFDAALGAKGGNP